MTRLGSTNTDILLLWLATYAGVPLPLLIDGKFELLFNLPNPNWEKMSIGLKLLDWNELGLIEFRQQNQVVILHETDIYHQLSRSCKILERSQATFYWLTEKGGKLWEEVFSPKWDLAILYELSLRNNTSPSEGQSMNIRMEASSRELLDPFVQFASLDGQIGSDSRTGVAEIIPWKLLYWKELPSGYALEPVLESPLWWKRVRRLPSWHTPVESLLH